MDARVGSEDDVGLVVPRELLKEVRGRGGLPQELVGLAGAPVAAENIELTQPEAYLDREGGQPLPVLRRGIREGVAIGEPGEVVVPGIRGSALAVVQAPSDGVVVVAADDMHTVGLQQRKDLVGMGTERAQITEAEERVDLPALCIRDGGRQGQMVGVDAPEHGDALERGPGGRISAHEKSCPYPGRFAQMAPLT